MVRIELDTVQPSEKEIRQTIKQEIKKESVKSELKNKFRRIGRRLGCYFIVVLVFFGIVAIILATVAKTGLWSIPIFSEIFYQPPQPIRVVNVDQLGQQNLLAEIISHLADDLLDNSEISFNFSEAELTLLARQLGANSKILQTKILVESLQTVITSQEIEVFVQLQLLEQPILIFGIYPEVIDQQLVFSLTRWQIGELSLPKKYGRWIIERFVGYKVDSLFHGFLQAGFDKIELTEGEIGFIKG